MTELLCLLLKPALYAVSNPRKYWYLIPFAVAGWLVDCILCYTFWCLLAGWPKHGEYTISDTLERLCRAESSDQKLFIEIARKINRVDPLHSHIRAVL